MRTYSWTLKITANITLAFYLWCFGPLFQLPTAFAAEKKQKMTQGQGSSSKGQGSKNQTTAEPRPQTAGERFQKTLEDIHEALGKAEGKSQKSVEPSEELAAIKTKRTSLEEINSALKSDFASTEKRIRDANLPGEILKRHQKFLAHYQSNLKELIGNLEQLERAEKKSEVDAAVKKAKEHLDRVKKPSTHKKIDPNRLPHRTVKAKPKAPRLTPEEYQRDFPQQKTKSKQKVADSRLLPDLLASKPQRKPVLLAFNETASDIPFSLGVLPLNPQSELSTLNYQIAQAVTSPPSADDLTETLEVQFTPEIQTIANSLGKNSLRLYEFVRNNFKYEPYYGSLKGTQQTLREKAGNDFDLASLLISLYRSAGIPAHYVVATISIPLPQAQNWLGIDDPRMVGRLLASAGVPVSIDYTAGIVRLEHVLVQAWVPFQNGRGALNGPGDTWVYVDPSFKESKVTQILNQSIPAFDQTQYLGQLSSQDPSEYYSATVQENLNTTSPGRTVYAVARHRETITQNFGMLLGMPQYEIVSQGAIFQEIPDQYRYKIVFELTDTDRLEQSLTYQTSTVELAGKRITLSYAPSTTDDESIIRNYGDIFNTPAYLVKLKPELRISGVSVAQGAAIGFGSTQPFIMKFISPDGYAEQIENSAVSGAYYAVALDLQTVPQNMVFERTQKLKTVSDIINSGGTVSRDDYTGELLYSTALAYFQKLDAANRKSQEFLKINDLRGVSEAIFSIDVQAVSLFGIPRSADVSGMHIDVDRDMHLPIPVDGNIAKIKEYNLLIGSNSSFFEHKVIEDIYPTEAISAVKGLQLANAQGIQIQTINGGNINAILPTLQVGSEIKTDITNAVNAGKEVIIPHQEILVGDWLGAGYIVMNPQTGEAGYIISGGFAGGSSISISLATYIKAAALSGNVAIYAEMSRIESSLDHDFIWFPGADNLYGTQDDVKLLVANEHTTSQTVWGPPNTACDGQISSNFYAPHFDIAAQLLELNAGVMDKKLTPNLKVSDMVINSGSSSYGRISRGFVGALEDYIQLLKDNNMTPIITSAYRTWYHNCELISQGAVNNSNHIDGIAADVKVGDENVSVALGIAKEMFWGVGKYSNRVHVDFGEARTW